MYERLERQAETIQNIIVNKDFDVDCNLSDDVIMTSCALENLINEISQSVNQSISQSVNELISASQESYVKCQTRNPKGKKSR